MAKKSIITSISLELPTGKQVEIKGYKTFIENQVFQIFYDGRSGYVRQDLFVSKKPIARNDLHRQGVMITSDGDWRKILEAIEDVRGFEAAPLIEGPGWTGNYFADQRGNVYSPKRTAKGIAIYGDGRARATTEGDLIGWREQVAIPLTGQTLPMLAVLAALAAPLIGIAGESQNFGFEFCGSPGTGKSTCLTIMASIAGNPSQIPKLNASMFGIEAMFAEHNDLPFVLDEGNLVDRRDPKLLMDLAFRLANGTIKVTAFQPDRAQYRFIFATSANKAFHKRLADLDADTASAALQRLFPLNVPSDNEFGVFENLPEGFASSGELAEHLEAAIAMQFGTPMRRLLQRLVDERAMDTEGLREKIHKSIKKFEKAVGVTETKRGKSRASSAFGLLFAAGVFAKANGILPKSWRCLAACLAGYRNYQTQLPEQTPLITRLLTIANRPQTLDLRNGKLPSLSDAEVEQHGAFLRVGVRGRLELLISEDLRQEFFSDWSTLQHTPEFKAMNRRDPDHLSKQRQIRKGRKKERFLLFILPRTLADNL